jgi:hypothetical protein
MWPSNNEKSSLTDISTLILHKNNFHEAKTPAMQQFSLARLVQPVTPTETKSVTLSCIQI